MRPGLGCWLKGQHTKFAEMRRRFLHIISTARGGVPASRTHHSVAEGAVRHPESKRSTGPPQRCSSAQVGCPPTNRHLDAWSLLLLLQIELLQQFNCNNSIATTRFNLQFCNNKEKGRQATLRAPDFQTHANPCDCET